MQQLHKEYAHKKAPLNIAPKNNGLNPIRALTALFLFASRFCHSEEAGRPTNVRAGGIYQQFSEKNGRDETKQSVDSSCPDVRRAPSLLGMTKARGEKKKSGQRRKKEDRKPISGGPERKWEDRKVESGSQ